MKEEPQFSPRSARITRRHLPHWDLPESTYFITFRLRARPLPEEEILLVKKHIVSGGGRYYVLLAAQVMPDHVHLLLRPWRNLSLSRILKGIKGTTARLLNLRRGSRRSLWQEEYFDEIVRTRNELRDKLNYMFRNPLTAGLTADPWKWAGWYVNEEMDW